MPLSELTIESYFKTATLVRDWRDYHFCGRMFHPPLLVSNKFFFASVYTGISIQLVAITTFCFATRNTLHDFSATAQNEIGFPIRVGRFVGDLVCVMSGWYLPSSTWSWSVF